MFTKYKIWILPLFVLLFASSTLFYEKPSKESNFTLSKANAFPYKKESKTEWTKSTWFNKISKTFSNFICLLTKNKIERTTVSTILRYDNRVFYTSNYFHPHSGRAPPKIS